jgi:flagellar biosynthesis chaperone FliJ
MLKLSYIFNALDNEFGCSICECENSLKDMSELPNEQHIINTQVQNRFFNCVYGKDANEAKETILKRLRNYNNQIDKLKQTITDTISLVETASTQ